MAVIKAINLCTLLVLSTFLLTFVGAGPIYVNHDTGLGDVAPQARDLPGGVFNDCGHETGCSPKVRNLPGGVFNDCGHETGCPQVRDLPGGVFNDCGHETGCPQVRDVAKITPTPPPNQPQRPNGVINARIIPTPPPDRTQDLASTCTTIYVQSTPWAKGPTLTVWPATSTVTNYVPCGQCDLSVVNPGGVGPEIGFTTTVTAAGIATATMIACE